FVRTDSRTPGINRLIERWAQRSGIEAMTVSEVAHRIAFESLHVLGVVDLGDVDDDGDGMGPTLRITPRGRAYLGAAESPAGTPVLSRFLDTHALRVGPAARIAEVIGLSAFTEIGAVTGHL